MKYITSGNPVVDSFGSLAFCGNVIPETWYEHLKMPSGRTDLNAIVILAEIVYWYRPRQIKDEETGSVSWEKRFRADKLQKSYQQLADKFGLTKRQVSDAVHRLVDQGIITTELRDMTVEGLRLTNVMFMEPVYKRVLEITTTLADGDETENGGTSLESTGDPPTIERDTPPAQDRTYTKTTTKTITQTTQNKSAAPDGADASGSGDPLSVPGSPISAFYFGQFGRSRWATPAQKALFLKTEQEVGGAIMRDAVLWGAQNNISRVSSICTTAKKMARNSSGDGLAALMNEEALANAAFGEGWDADTSE